jgi:hypothetical protein
MRFGETELVLRRALRAGGEEIKDKHARKVLSRQKRG